MAYKNTYIALGTTNNYVLLYYIVLNESDLSASQAEYTIHTQIKTHTLGVLESTLKSQRQKRLSGLLPPAFEGCQTSDFHLVNQQTRPTKAENTSSIMDVGWEGKREGKWMRETDRIMGSFHAWALYGVLSENAIYFIVLSITSVSLIILAPLRWKWKNQLDQRPRVQLRGQENRPRAGQGRHPDVPQL